MGRNRVFFIIKQLIVSSVIFFNYFYCFSFFPMVSIQYRYRGILVWYRIEVIILVS